MTTPSANTDSSEIEQRRRSRCPHVFASAEPITARVFGGDLLFREGLKRLFEDAGIDLLGEAEGLRDIEHVPAEAIEPNIVIVVDLPATLGDRDWVAMVRRVWSKTRIVALANASEETALSAAIRLGADGCLFKDMSPAALVQSIALVALGENVFPTRIARGLVGTSPKSTMHLTPREKDILQGLLAGHSNKVIANNLGTTDMTVKAQLRHLLRKIDARNRTQAALWARENGASHELVDSNYPIDAAN